MKEPLEIDFTEVDKEINTISTLEKKHSLNQDKDLLKLKSVLNQKPPKSFIRRNDYYGNDYIPIQIIERALVAIFDTYEPIMRIPPIVHGSWIIFMMDIVVTNPITKLKETYSGVADIPLMPKSQIETDMHSHTPAGPSFALMNAAKHIGRLFRAENDDCTKIFDTYFEGKIESINSSGIVYSKNPATERMLLMIEKSIDLSALEKLKNNITEETQAAYINKLKQFT